MNRVWGLALAAWGKLYMSGERVAAQDLVVCGALFEILNPAKRSMGKMVRKAPKGVLITLKNDAAVGAHRARTRRANM